MNDTYCCLLQQQEVLREEREVSNNSKFFTLKLSLRFGRSAFNKEAKMLAQLASNVLTLESGSELNTVLAYRSFVSFY